MTYVKVATKNLVKLTGVMKAFQRYFEEVKVDGEDAKSNVPEQPINEDVFIGAENRLKSLRNTTKYDYLVSIEGGLIEFFGVWFNVQVVIVQDSKGNKGVGLSQGYQIPLEYVDEAIHTSVAQVLDKIFEGKGGISVLTKNQFTRESLITDGTIMALAKVLNSNIW